MKRLNWLLVCFFYGIGSALVVKALFGLPGVLVIIVLNVFIVNYISEKLVKINFIK